MVRSDNQILHDLHTRVRYENNKKVKPCNKGSRKPALHLSFGHDCLEHRTVAANYRFACMHGPTGGHISYAGYHQNKVWLLSHIPLKGLGRVPAMKYLKNNKKKIETNMPRISLHVIILTDQRKLTNHYREIYSMFI